MVVVSVVPVVQKTRDDDAGERFACVEVKADLSGIEALAREVTEQEMVAYLIERGLSIDAARRRIDMARAEYARERGRR